MIKVHTGETSGICADSLIAGLGGRLTERNVFVVPDMFTLSYEASILDKLGLAGSFDIEVTSFSRLAARHIKENASAQSKPPLSAEAAVMLLARVIIANRERLTELKRLSYNVRFARDMYAVITDIRNNAIPPEAFAAAGEVLSGRISRKSADIALIYGAYLEELNKNYQDGSTALSAFCGSIEDDKSVHAANFYFADFYEFSGAQRAVLAELIRHARGVFFTAPTPKKGAANERIFPKLLPFIKELAAETGQKLEIIDAPPRKRDKKTPLLDLLFSYSSAAADKGADGFLQLKTAKSGREEIEELAATIRGLVDNGGYRYKDFAVISAGGESYSRLIAEEFSAAHIPYFEDVKRPLANENAAKILIKAFDAVKSGFKPESVLAFASLALLEVGHGDFSAFVNYINERGVERISNKAFDEPIAENVRKKVMKPLKELKNGAAKGREFTSEVRDFYSRLDFDKAILRLEDYQNKRGFTQAADACRQVIKKINTILDEFDGIFGNDDFKFDDFCPIIAAAMEKVQLSFVPLYADSVFIGDAGASRYEGAAVMYGIGMTDGAFPKEVSGGGLLSASDLELLKKSKRVRLDIKPNIRDKNLAARYTAREILSKPERLILSYPLYSNDLSKTEPSTVYTQLQGIYGVRAVEAGDSSEFIAVTTSKNEILPLVIHNPAPLQKVSVTELETYFSCPFKHFLSHTVRVKKSAEAKTAASDVGDILHKALELFYREEQNKAFFTCESIDVASRLVDRALETDAFKRFSELPGAKYELAKIKAQLADILVELTEQERYTSLQAVPCLQEVPITINTTCGTTINGKVDRIDVTSDGYAVIDYKTGNPAYIGLEFSDVYFGRKLQAPLYLNAAKEKTADGMLDGLFPLGAFYLQLPRGYVSDKGGAQLRPYRFKGIAVNGGEDGLAYLDERLSEATGYTAPMYGFGKALCGECKAIDEEELARLSAYALKLAEGALGEIQGGYIAQSPASDDECLRCGYKSICAGLGQAAKPRDTGRRVTLDEF